MKYLSIDIETTGLDIENNDILEFAAVYDDTANMKPLDELARFHCYFLRDTYKGSPYALAMHGEIFKKLANSKKYPKDVFTNVNNFNNVFSEFLHRINHTSVIEEVGHGYVVNNFHINVAGKNASGFDIPFLKKHCLLSNVKFHHRVVDPAHYFFLPTDETMPDSKTCMERAGLAGEVAHTAMEDALMVIKLFRKGLELRGSK